MTIDLPAEGVVYCKNTDSRNGSVRDGRTKIGQIKEELKAATEAMLPSFIMAYESDERSGVIKLVEQAKKDCRN